MKKIVHTLTYTLLLALLATAVHAVSSAEPSAEQLATESEAYIKSTAKDTPTAPSTIVAKIDEACVLLAEAGPAAFPKFKGKDSPFLFGGTYIWIHSLKDTRMLMHPIKYKMEGKKLIALKDERGKRFFAVMSDVAIDPGQGWIEYFWPVPGTKDLARKVSYVKKCTMANGVEVVIGCGMYNGDPAAMEKLEIR